VPRSVVAGRCDDASRGTVHHVRASSTLAALVPALHARRAVSDANSDDVGVAVASASGGLKCKCGEPRTDRVLCELTALGGVDLADVLCVGTERGVVTSVPVTAIRQRVTGDAGAGDSPTTNCTAAIAVGSAFSALDMQLSRFGVAAEHRVFDHGASKFDLDLVAVVGVDAVSGESTPSIVVVTASSGAAAERTGFAGNDASLAPPVDGVRIVKLYDAYVRLQSMWWWCWWGDTHLLSSVYCGCAPL
jgi:hypothetical protein